MGHGISTSDFERGLGILVSARNVSPVGNNKYLGGDLGDVGGCGIKD
jgi:hypothetical protein